MSGAFQGTLTLGNHTLVSSGGRDGIVASLDVSGIWQVAHSLGGEGRDDAVTVEFSGENWLSVKGRFFGNASFGDNSLKGDGGWSQQVYEARIDLRTMEWSSVVVIDDALLDYKAPVWCPGT